MSTLMASAETNDQNRSTASPDWRGRVEARLDGLVPKGKAPSLAARHSLLAPGKRLRALLTIETARQFGGDPQCALDPACAVEMVHTASLVFDDLPAMDDAALRRGEPTAHIAFGEGVAILAGIGLLNGAFGVLAAAPGLTAPQREETVRLLSEAVGWEGLVGGQALDIGSGAGSDIAAIHHGKTGALFVAATLIGAVCAGADEKAFRDLRAFGYDLGQAYQALDDVLDGIAGDVAAGKTTQRDDGKATALTEASGDVAAAAARAMAALDGARCRVAGTGGGATPLTHFIDGIAAHFRTFLDRNGVPS